MDSDKKIYTFKVMHNQSAEGLDDKFLNILNKYASKTEDLSSGKDRIHKYYIEFGEFPFLKMCAEFSAGNMIDYKNNHFAGLIKIFGNELSEEDLDKLPIIQNLEKDLSTLPYKCF